VFDRLCWEYPGAIAQARCTTGKVQEVTIFAAVDAQLLCAFFYDESIQLRRRLASGIGLGVGLTTGKVQEVRRRSWEWGLTECVAAGWEQP
jgi:hypothetical protein